MKSIAEKSKFSANDPGEKLCAGCFHQRACEFELDEDGRCLFYIKDEQFGVDDSGRIHSVNALTIDYDVIERFVKRQNV